MRPTRVAQSPRPRSYPHHHNACLTSATLHESAAWPRNASAPPKSGMHFEDWVCCPFSPQVAGKGLARLLWVTAGRWTTPWSATNRHQLLVDFRWITAQCCGLQAVRQPITANGQAHPEVGTRFATGVCQLRDDRIEQGPTEPHTGRSTFLLSSGGAGGGHYCVALGTGPIATEHQFPCQTLVAYLLGTLWYLAFYFLLCFYFFGWPNVLY